MEAKSVLRRNLQQVLRNLPEQARHDGGQAVLQRLSMDEGFLSAKVIASYAAMPMELDTEAIHAWSREHGKIMVYPKVQGEGRDLAFYQVDHLSELVATRGIREPNSAKHPIKNSIDLFLVPGLGFSAQGWRLGRGQGFYDRTLNLEIYGKSLRYGVAFEEQLVREIPIEAHDIKLHKVFTPLKVYSS